MSEVADGEVLKEVKRRKWYDFRPRLDHRATPLSTMPPTIDPKNWTKVTPEEMKAHQERLEIRGRLRREYWIKRYHPVNHRFFNTLLTDKAFVHFNRSKSVYHMKETLQFSMGTFKALMFAFVVPCAVVYAAARWDASGSKYDSIVKD